MSRDSNKHDSNSPGKGDKALSDAIAAFDLFLRDVKILDSLLSSCTEEERRKIRAYLENRLAGKMLERKFKELSIQIILQNALNSVSEIQDILVGLAPVPDINRQK